MVELTKEWFDARWAGARDRAGKRYTPQLNVSLPLGAWFDSVCQNEAFFERYSELHAALVSAGRGLHLEEVETIIPADQTSAFRDLFAAGLAALGQLLDLKDRRPTRLPFEAVLLATNDAERALRGIAKRLETGQPTTSHGPQSPADLQKDAVWELQRALRILSHEIESGTSEISNEPHILLLGSAGTGKTHLLCEMTRQRVEAGKPALMFLGQAFQKPFASALDALVHSVEPTADARQFLTALDQYARAHSTRCLLSIDAVNEGHRQSWSRGLPDLIDTIRNYPAIALVIGCRTPFEQMLAPSPEALHMYPVVHYGFPPDEQITAIDKYFRAYHIPLPEVPILEEEFANPLFLKLFCEALERATVDQKHAQIKAIASGQRGMTYILENFVDYKGSIIASRLRVDPNLAWNFLKNRFAPRLAADHAGSIPLADASALADAEQPQGLAPGALLRELINEDVLAEDLTFDNGAPREAVRCTYQKFADHLVARHILASHLNPSTPETIQASLQDAAGLGAYFIDPEAAMARINLVQALMVEFPTRINNSGELLDYLEWEGFPIPLCRAFLAGLYWREPSSINESTSRLVTAFLRHDDLKEETLNVLLALSVKPKHPFRASRLDAFLEGQSLVARDLFWSEFLRNTADRGTAYRILAWAEHLAPKAPAPECVKLYIIVLKWFLTSTQRGFRDRVTHALFRLGRKYPQILFEEAIQSLGLNDPYVPQRMLAASYGVAMSLWQGVGNARFQGRTLPRFARQLYSRMFGRSARFGTTHTLSREYAQGTIHLAVLLAPRLLSDSQIGRVGRPCRAGSLRKWRERDDRDEGRYREGDAPLGMDFANYTLGRLVRDRDAYDDQHLEYWRVKRQILWRIYDLGYTLEAFSAADRAIARQSWHAEMRGREGGRTDRYGKKYAWIAFFELAGHRMDLGLMDASERVADADIDPSFPELPEEHHVFAEPWTATKGSVREWILSTYRPRVEDGLALPRIRDQIGPWVMIDGFVTREAADRTIFALFDAVFVKSEHAAQLASAVASMEYPGNHNFLRPEEEYYTYAGEVPWAEMWHCQQYPRSVEANGAEIPVALPVREYSWESYHSDENQAGGLSFPSKEVGQDLGLFVQIPSVATAERATSRVATLPIIWGSAHHDYEPLLYMRQDLLDRYLRKHEFALLMVVWGERRGNYHLGGAREMEGSFDIHQVLHKQVFTYRDGSWERLM